MKRREFITLVGGATAIWPLATRAQQAVIPLVGWLGVGPPQGNDLAAFRRGLNEQGYAEGRNVAIEFRVSEQYRDLPTLAAELVRRRAAVIFTITSFVAAQTAKAATTTIPIVFTVGIDPVKYGLITSLNRPGGNATGVTFLGSQLGPKRLELARELVPQAAVIGVLVNPNNPATSEDAAGMQAAARSVGLSIIFFNASAADEIDAAFADLDRQRAGALVVLGDAYLNSRRDQLVALAARHGIPTIYFFRDFVRAGGLMSYADDRFETTRQAGLYVGRILKGENPADLPVVQPTKFELFINLKTAKALGLTIPESFLLRADEVIE
ncbi:MAG TPA: ABC transporter substrate-binding protein [Xanthobacteraceae bacterium]|jgi:putative ABC transport system substrate-binding protein